MQKYSVFHKKSKAKFKILYIMYNTKESPPQKTRRLGTMAAAINLYVV
jgi:hypothetical protein